jgi:hypothetical protein
MDSFMLKHIFGIVNIQDSISVSTLPTKEQIQKKEVEKYSKYSK